LRYGMLGPALGVGAPVSVGWSRLLPLASGARLPLIVVSMKTLEPGAEVLPQPHTANNIGTISTAAVRRFMREKLPIRRRDQSAGFAWNAGGYRGRP